MGGKKKEADQIILKDSAKKLISVPIQVSNKLNKCFCSVANECREEINEDRKYVSPIENEYNY